MNDKKILSLLVKFSNCQNLNNRISLNIVEKNCCNIIEYQCNDAKVNTSQSSTKVFNIWNHTKLLTKFQHNVKFCKFFLDFTKILKNCQIYKAISNDL